MQYFDNTFKLRLSHADKYKAHQAVDTLVQERLNIKLPYSWRAVPYPGAEHYSIVQLRSSVQMKLPGEREVALSLSQGALLQFRCNICSMIRVYEGKTGKRIGRIGSTQEVIDKLKSTAEKSGFELLTATEEQEQIFKIIKPQNRPFTLGHRELLMLVRVNDVALTEKAIVEGLGSKRIFGFGYLSDIEVL